MKFLHAADIHLDSPLLGLERYEGAPVDVIRGATRRALQNMVELAIREQVDFVVIAGDLYDGDWRDFNTGMFFVHQMAILREAGISVCLIAGNHDAASTMTRKLRLPANPDGSAMMLACDQPETRRFDDLGIAIHGRSFANQAETRNMVPDYPNAIPHFFNLGLLHTSLNGSDEHDTYAPCTPADLAAKGYDYWALGHIHKRTQFSSDQQLSNMLPIIYSGNVQGRHIRETGPRGCYVITENDRRISDVTFHSLDVFRWELCRVPCEQSQTVDDVLLHVRNELATLGTNNRELPMGVRVILEGATRAHQKLASERESLTAEIRSLATIATGGLAWIEQVKLTTSYLNEPRPKRDADGPVAELIRYLDDLPNDAVELEKLLDEFKDLARKLPREVMQAPDGLQFGNIDWIREMVHVVKPLLLDQLDD